MSLSPVRRGRRGRVAVDEVHLVDVLTQLAGLGVAEPHRSPGRSSSAAAPISGVCTSPAPSSPRRRRPSGNHGIGCRDGPVGPEAIQPPPSTVAIRGAGRRTTESAKNADGVGCQLRYVSNSVGPKSPEPAATSVTDGSAAVAAMLPVPPPFTNSSSACSRTARTAAIRRLSSSGRERRCIIRMPRASTA